MKRADFRSDTVTHPSKKMRQTIADAIVGDDGFGDDPTVKELEKLAADKTGKAAALFCPTGTMANQIAICAHTNPGDEILVDDQGHIAWFEGGGAALNAFVQIRTYHLENYRLDPMKAEKLLRLPIIDCPTMKVLCVENTLNMYGGIVWPLENLQELQKWAHSHGMVVHLDGARLFNAARAAGVEAKTIVDTVDSAMFCLSKGLGAPIGSMLVGSEEFILKARRVRKRLGGQMRQVGILASAGILALTEGVARLQEDHDLASSIAQRIAKEVPTLQPTHEVQTNILIYKMPKEKDPNDLAAQLAKEDVLVCPFPGNSVRIVTHLDVGEEEADRLLSTLKAYFEKK